MFWDFTYHCLYDYFDFLKTKGTVISFSNMKNVRNPIVLRHDVDLDIEAASILATIEFGRAMESTFFFRVTASEYNIFSRQAKTILKDLCEMGFEIGLHFDQTLYAGLNLEKSLKVEAKMLESVLPKGNKVKSVSLHNPSINGKLPLPVEFIDAYDSEVWSDKNYISDSCMYFRYKDPVALVNKAAFPIQILLHPFHYTGGHCFYAGKMRRYFYHQMRSIHDDYQDNPTYVRDLGGKELEKVLLKEDVC